MKNIINLVAEKMDGELRLDSFVSQKNEISRSRVKTLILEGKLKLNNNIVKEPSKKVVAGDHIKVEITKPKKASLKPFNYNLNIIYEDKDLFVINKSSGISMHPGAGNYDKTIVNALINLDKKNLSNIGDELRPGIVHRIDKDTSGLVVIAKNNISHENLSKQFSNHTISRKYLALIWGKLRPRNGKIETLITRSSRNRQMMEVGITKGKKAITNYQTLEIFENNKVPTLSLVECTLETGRTHQIRVHMSYKGNNILGDKKYKKKFKKFKNIEPKLEEDLLNLDRQFLHAKILGFDHPKTGERINFSSDLPKDLENILKKLRNSVK
tara:strand:- start:378 stop:1355 length:978 start_codon:yes stop_codon:yes gene_type:complete